MTLVSSSIMQGLTSWAHMEEARWEQPYGFREDTALDLGHNTDVHYGTVHAIWNTRSVNLILTEIIHNTPLLLVFIAVGLYLSV